MSKQTPVRAGQTIKRIAKAKVEGRRISAITCYDSAFARLVDETNIDIVLVGDSLGNVMLGYENTIPVTMDDMCHHIAAVSRSMRKPFLVGDMPFLSYNLAVSQALENAGRMVQQGGAQAVKLEGGRKVCPQVKAIVEAGIPVMGHLGLTPQSIHALGGYSVQGRGEEAAALIVEDAMALQEAGVFSLVLEMVPRQLAAKLTKMLTIPTIGIGAGPECDGQIIVLHDILGFEEDFKPKFLKKYANLGKIVREAVSAYDNEVKEGIFPSDENSFSG